MNLIDIHAHLNFPQFAEDREGVIKRAREVGVRMINVGTDLATSREVVALAEKYPSEMWATVGIHPTDIGEISWDELEHLAQNKKVVAIGECGLDYFHVKDVAERQKQAEVFEQQIALAQKVNKPLMIHCRDAYDDLLAVLNNFPGVTGNVHFFAGDWPTAKKFLALGFTLSFTGAITFASNYDEVIKNLPLESLLIETDCPFVAPVPHRGQRNEPSYVVEVAKRVALLKGISLEEVARVTTATARLRFGLDLL
ncbi:MAG: TatD family hydrolase [Patescibacteria group bacterium]